MFADSLTIARKEWIDAFRDRRALFAAFAYALFGPLVLAAVINSMAREETREPQRLVHLQNAEAAPALVSALRNDGYSFLAEAPVVLTLPVDFVERASRGKPVTLTLAANLVEHAAEVDELRMSIDRWSATVATQRLLARGIAPHVTRPLRIDVENSARLSDRGRAVILMLVLFLILAPFFASTSVAIDTTSGERERGSLESLLAMPSRPAAAICGKWLMTAAVAVLGTAVTVAIGAMVINQAPLSSLGVRLYFDASTAAMVVTALVPLALLVAAVQLLIALAAKSFKEGQTYLTLFSFLPVFVGLLATRAGSEVNPSLPIIQEMRILEAIATGATPPPADIAVMAATYAVVTLLALTAATYRIGRESILAGG